jgi:hypothetical protein
LVTAFGLEGRAVVLSRFRCVDADKPHLLDGAIDVDSDGVAINDVRDDRFLGRQERPELGR